MQRLGSFEKMPSQEYRIIVYTIDGGEISIETNAQPIPDLKSGKIYKLDCNGKLLNVRPYYRRMINGTLNIFMEEDNSNEEINS
jgi:hypothetical protein